ncbi:MAG: glycosyltransferase family 2 protein, partial [Bacteroidota bacterium]
AYNAEKYIDKSIQSILSQSYSNIEILIANDFSTDNTLHEIKKLFHDPRVKLYNMGRKSKSPFELRNFLFTKAKGDYITFQDADDWSDPERLEKQLRVFQDDKDMGMVGTWFNVVDKNGKFLRNARKPVKHKDILNSFGKTYPIFGPTIMIKKEVLDKVGGFRDYFPASSFLDYDWPMLIAENFKTAQVPEFLYFYRQHGLSISKRIQPERLVMKQFFDTMALQRKTRGMDDIQQGKLVEAKAFFEKLVKDYKRDKTRHFRDYAGIYAYNKMYFETMEASWEALKKEPFRTINQKYFFKSIYSWLQNMVYNR